MLRGLLGAEETGVLPDVPVSQQQQVTESAAALRETRAEKDRLEKLWFRYKDVVDPHRRISLTEPVTQEEELTARAELPTIERDLNRARLSLNQLESSHAALEKSVREAIRAQRKPGLKSLIRTADAKLQEAIEIFDAIGRYQDSTDALCQEHTEKVGLFPALAVDDSIAGGLPTAWPNFLKREGWL